VTGKSISGDGAAAVVARAVTERGGGTRKSISEEGAAAVVAGAATETGTRGREVNQWGWSCSCCS
jgi:hypothetical protein